MHIDELLKIVADEKGSDLHITVSSPPMMRKSGRLIPVTDEIVTDRTARELARQIAPDEKFLELEEIGETDFSYTDPTGTRFRVNAYKQRGYHGIAARMITQEIPRPASLGLPPVYENLAHKHKGLILIAGPTGSGKSTTLASIIDYINTNRNVHILTLEDPVEYVHKNKKSIVNQREIGLDSGSFAAALRAALRQDPDVILIGEMRDPETIDIALTAAETGHLVLSTLHTVSAPKTIDRIIGSFPPHRQEQVRVQLAGVLEAIISQQLLPTVNGTDRVAVFEVMTRTPAIANLIRDGKIHQLYSTMQTSAQFGMKLMDAALTEVCKSGLVSYDTAFEYAVDQDAFRKMN